MPTKRESNAGMTDIRMSMRNKDTANEPNAWVAVFHLVLLRAINYTNAAHKIRAGMFEFMMPRIIGLRGACFRWRRRAGRRAGRVEARRRDRTRPARRPARSQRTDGGACGEGSAERCLHPVAAAVASEVTDGVAVRSEPWNSLPKRLISDSAKIWHYHRDPSGGMGSVNIHPRED
jgi:hypothetical protein